jgi:hypothetical protein
MKEIVMNDKVEIFSLDVNLTQHGSLRCYGTGYVRCSSWWVAPKFEWVMESDGSITFTQSDRMRNTNPIPLEIVSEVKQELRKLLNKMSERLITKI